MANFENKLNAKQKEEPRKGILFVLSGPSGVGKGTVIEKALEQVPNLKRSVSVTTRDKRNGEINGVDYFFSTKALFQEMCNKHELIEWAEYASCLYGTPKVWVENELKSGVDVLLVIEVQGAAQIRKIMPDAVLIFLSPPSFAELESRLSGRGTERQDEMEIRLKQAKTEIAEKNKFDYEVINDNLEKAVNNLVNIIYVERQKPRT